MSIMHITNAQQINEQVEKNKMVVLNFWATWCGPCRMFAEVLEQLEEEVADIQVLKVNVDEHPEISEKFDVMGIPHTRVIMNDAMYEPRWSYSIRTITRDATSRTRSFSSVKKRCANAHLFYIAIHFPHNITHYNKHRFPLKMYANRACECVHIVKNILLLA